MMKIGEIPSENGNKSFDLFTGAIRYEVIAINPTLKQAEKAELKMIKQEPQYVKEFNDAKFVEIAVYLKAIDEEVNNQIVPLKWLISFDDFTNREGTKTQFIDATGRTTWATDKDSLVEGDWFTNINPRPAKKGEEAFYRFLNRWLNMNTKKEEVSECLFDFNKWMKGDFSELQDVFYKMVIPQQEKTGQSYTCFVLTGVKVRENDDKIYHNLEAYNKQFYSGGFSAEYVAKLFKTYIEKNDFNSFGTDNNPVLYSFDIEKFDKDATKPDENKGDSIDSLGSFEGAPSIASSSAPVADDQLPF